LETKKIWAYLLSSSSCPKKRKSDDCFFEFDVIVEADEAEVLLLLGAAGEALEGDTKPGDVWESISERRM